MDIMDVILDSIHEGLLAVDQAGRVTIFNRAAQRLMGLDAGQVVGKLVAEVIPNTRLHLVLQSGQAELDQIQHTGRVAVLANRVPLKDEGGRISGAVAVFRDISEIERLTEETTSLQKTRALLKAIIDSTQDAISVVDEKGLGSLINQAYTRLIGLTEEDVLNRPATVDIAEGESMHLQVLRTGQAVKNVPMKVGPDRKEVLVDAAPIVVNGTLKGSVAVVHDVSEIRRLSVELERARRLIRRLEARYTFDDIIGESASMLLAVDQARKAAETPATVILRGDSGTGKELFAHAIHQAGTRQRGQFVQVNCAAITASLLESELFGYVEGSFTGARRGGHKGYFAEADGGTIFLDEVGEINPGAQVKLLRVLQEREIVRVGDSRPIHVDVRVIAATNANLEQLVRKGQFREDLYYRLNVLPIHIPPLRHRREDIPLLVNYLLRKLNQAYGRNVTGISPGALRVLQAYNWPGNVRELENVLGRALINMKRGESMAQIAHLPPLGFNAEENIGVTVSGTEPDGDNGESLTALREHWERQTLDEALQRSGGNRTRAARRLGISIRSLYNKMDRYGLS